MAYRRQFEQMFRQVPKGSGMFASTGLLVGLGVLVVAANNSLFNGKTKSVNCG